MTHLSCHSRILAPAVNLFLRARLSTRAYLLPVAVWRGHLRGLRWPPVSSVCPCSRRFSPTIHVLIYEVRARVQVLSLSPPPLFLYDNAIRGNFSDRLVSRTCEREEGSKERTRTLVVTLEYLSQGVQSKGFRGARLSRISEKYLWRCTVSNPFRAIRSRDRYSVILNPPLPPSPTNFARIRAIKSIVLGFLQSEGWAQQRLLFDEVIFTRDTHEVLCLLYKEMYVLLKSTHRNKLNDI